jgi:hypothetical protein
VFLKKFSYREKNSLGSN